MAVPSDARIVAVWDFIPGEVSLIETQSQSVLATLTIPTFSTVMAFSPAGDRLVVDSGLGEVNVLERCSATEHAT
ncbi:MAG: hypothetical protein ACI841_003109 [Planctomycetota bacterium]|jgi:hypothetical protein